MTNKGYLGQYKYKDMIYTFVAGSVWHIKYYLWCACYRKTKKILWSLSL